MVIDTSVLVAILKAEPDADHFEELLVHSPRSTISAASYVEVVMVVTGKDLDLDGLDRLLSRMDIRVEPFTAEDAMLAKEAFLKYGKGQKHPAQLNMGDCFSYALAKRLREPLLYKGDDFSRTDVQPV